MLSASSMMVAASPYGGEDAYAPASADGLRGEQFGSVPQFGSGAGLEDLVEMLSGMSDGAPRPDDRFGGGANRYADSGVGGRDRPANSYLAHDGQPTYWSDAGAIGALAINTPWPSSYPYQIVIIVPVTGVSASGSVGGASSATGSTGSLQGLAAPQSASVAQGKTTDTASDKTSTSSNAPAAYFATVQHSDQATPADTASASARTGGDAAHANAGRVAATGASTDNVAVPAVLDAGQADALAPALVDAALSGNETATFVASAAGYGATGAVHTSPDWNDASAAVDAAEGGVVDLLMTTPEELAGDADWNVLGDGLAGNGPDEAPTGEAAAILRTTGAAADAMAGVPAAGATDGVDPADPSHVAGSAGVAASASEGGMIELDPSAADGAVSTAPPQYAATGSFITGADTALGRYQAFELATDDALTQAYGAAPVGGATDLVSTSAHRPTDALETAMADRLLSPKSASAVAVAASAGYVAAQRRSKRQRQAARAPGIANA
ncbi:MAG: hypothetical protein KDA63_01205 [Planctomycetales bacterium]|nr:hypothetical protein [Planctomycetales bacterium]